MTPMRAGAAILLALLAAPAIAMCSSSLLLHESAGMLRSHFLRQTPPGSTVNEVLGRLRDCGYQPVFRPAYGFLRQEPGAGPGPVGQSSIEADLGHYRTLFLFDTSVETFWGFDSSGRLIDVWVWKTTDAP